MATDFEVTKRFSFRALNSLRPRKSTQVDASRVVILDLDGVPFNFSCLYANESHLTFIRVRALSFREFGRARFLIDIDREAQGVP